MFKITNDRRSSGNVRDDDRTTEKMMLEKQCQAVCFGSNRKGPVVNGRQVEGLYNKMAIEQTYA